MVIGVFSKEENSIRDIFYIKFSKEIELFNKTLDIYSSFLRTTSGKIKDTEYPIWTILILQSQTLPLMNNALVLLSSGYIRASEIMNRVVSEATILSAYFKEFPEAEVEYRLVNYRDFFHKYKIEEMLARVEKKGRLFIPDKNKKTAKKIRWNKKVYINLFKESCRFLHNDPKVLYDLMRDNTKTNTENAVLIMGPQLYSDDILSMGLRRLFNSLLTSLAVLGLSLNIYPDNDELKIMKSVSKIINKTP
jgi:hypothetical protein